MPPWRGEAMSIRDWDATREARRAGDHWEIPGEPEIRQSIEYLRWSHSIGRKFALLFGIVFVSMCFLGAYMDNTTFRNPEAADKVWRLLFNWFAFPVCVISVIAIVWSSLRNAGLACPCCGKPFHSRVLAKWGRFPFTYHNALSRKCLNCGLKLNGSNIAQARSTATEHKLKEAAADE
jgi:hypothetical protein